MSNKQNKSEPVTTPEEPPKNEDNGEEKKKEEQEELPPFEVVEGSRIPASSFKFQFKNVEYSSGRNKTLLCYTVEREGQTFRGYLEDEHVSAHAEEAFFTNVLPQYLSSTPVSVTCYVSSSPCINCAASIARCIRRNKNVKLQLVVARLFQWEESEIRGALRGLNSAGCKVRMMKGADYSHVWQNFVEPDIILDDEGNAEQPAEQGAFIPWEDLEENARYYEEKLSEILR